MEPVYTHQDYYNDTSLSSDTDEFETLEAADFLDAFDNLTDFEKEIGIDGDVNDNNEQSLGDDSLLLPKRHHSSQIAKDTTNAHSQPETILTTLLSNTTINAHVIPDLSQIRTSISPYLSLDSQSLNSNLTSSWPPIVRSLEQDSLKADSVALVGHTGKTGDRSALPSPSISYHARQTSNQGENDDHKKRQEHLAISVDKRRQQFQHQQEQNNAHVPELLNRIEWRKQHLDQQHQLDQQKRTTQGRAICDAMGTALSEALNAAEAYGVARLGTTPPLSPINYVKAPTSTTHHQEEDLDPEDPDPWMEERGHYLLIGRIKRAEYLQDLRFAKALGKELPPPPLYHPTGLPRHDPDLPLSRKGTGISVSGTMLDVVVSNSHAHPTNQWGPRTPHDYHHQHQLPKSNTFSTSSSNATSPSIKSSTLLVSNLPANITGSTLRTLQSDGLTSVFLHQSNHTATFSFTTTECAVTFRRKYDRSLLGGKRIVVHFAHP